MPDRMADPFSTTRWSLIVAAGGQDEQSQQALMELCDSYWRPVYAYFRRHDNAPGDAADLTQAFFLHLLEHRGFERADPSRGRFRAYLVTAARNFLANARQRDRTARRGASAPHQSIDAIDAERQLSLSAQDRASSPEAVFERQWALEVTARAMDRLRRDYASRGQEHVFDELRPYLTSDVPPPAGRSAGSDALRTALHRARVRFGDALRTEIRETVDDNDAVEDELRHLLRVLAD